MQNEITTPSDLLDARGQLVQKGWARDLLLHYNRTAIGAATHRIKEWDYYCILDHDRNGAAFTVADNGYMGFLALTVFDFAAPAETTRTLITPFPLGDFNMPHTSKKGDVHIQRKGVRLHFMRSKGQRRIVAEWPAFDGTSPLEADIILQQDESADSMTIATPFPGNKYAFYYNQKINCLPARGHIHCGARKIEFTPDRSSGVLDWGRGVWTWSNTWYWGSASGLHNRKPFGFNIGYGFGDTSAASENIVFYDGRGHKLDQICFNIPDDSFVKPWTFTSNDGRFEMDFVPVLDRFSSSNLLLIKSVQHQVFGRFSGTVVLDNGKKITIRDFMGFAEKVINRW